MTYFRPTPFTRAFRSLDAFTADVQDVPDTTTKSSSAEEVILNRREEKEEETRLPPAPVIKQISFEQIDFERRPIRVVGHACEQRRRRWNEQRERERDTYGLEYELKILQMKLNWMIFIVFVLAFVLIFKR